MNDRNYGKMPEREVIYHVANLQRHDRSLGDKVETGVLVALAGFIVGFVIIGLSMAFFS